jgi:hypothetical protein
VAAEAESEADADEAEEPEAPSAQPVPAPEPVRDPENESQPDDDAEGDPDAEPEQTPPDPGPHPDPDPEEKPTEAGSPSTDELIAQLRAGASQAAANTGGDAAARLVAMNMALDGASREEVEQHLEENFDVGDRDGLLDEVFSRVKA